MSESELEHFHMRIQNLELRSCDIHLMGKFPHSTMEIVQWDTHNEQEHCWALAYWKRGNDGYDLYFLGNRPFDSRVNATEFMELAERGQGRLDFYFQKTQNGESPNA